jgi:hypothetical protein
MRAHVQLICTTMRCNAIHGLPTRHLATHNATIRLRQCACGAVPSRHMRAAVDAVYAFCALWTYNAQQDTALYRARTVTWNILG